MDAKSRMRLHRTRLKQKGRKQVALHLPQDLIAACDRLVQSRQASRSVIVQEALRKYLGRRGDPSASVGIELDEHLVLDSERFAYEREQPLAEFLGDVVREWIACAHLRERLQRQEKLQDERERTIPMAFGPPMLLPKPRPIKRASPALIETADPRTLSHKLKIEIAKSRPLIWRRVLVPSNTILAELHRVIQVLFGWEAFHLFEFSDRFGEKIVDMSSMLYRVCPKEGSLLNYTYDFGDYWQLSVVVEAVLPDNLDGQVYQCLAGRNAGPPEDCGGPQVYQEIVQALKKRRGPDYRQARDIVGRGFKPDFFDRDAINEELELLLDDYDDDEVGEVDEETEEGYDDNPF